MNELCIKIRISAELNDSIAFSFLGDFYYYGYGVKQDYVKAKEYYEKSADQNYSYSFYSLGLLYLNGYGVKQDYKKAKEYLEKSAEQNNSDALCSLGILYLNGCGVKQNYKKAIEYLEKSAEQNNSNALCSLGYIYWNGIYVKHDYVKAINCFKESAENNNSNALLCLGQAYLFGDGVEQNYDKALNYFKSSANQNNLFAYLNLGFLYLFGIGVDKDINKATELLNKFFESEKNISINYSQVLNIMQQTNNDLVISKFKKICKTFFLPNTINNKYNNGLMNEVSKLFQFADALYQNQKRDSSHFFNHILEFLHNSFNFSKFSLNKYLSKLTILFEVGSEKGDPASLNILGLKYYNGDKKDYLKAKEYFKLASKQNDSYGFLNLGYYYFDGFSEAKDYFQAENYFRLSAKLGNSTAYYELGCMYEKGYGVKIINKKTNQYKKSNKIL